jgi:2-dehydro-3-deoxyphosphogluconate aldolase/(4S)-4-hydroxy-2-oxoglutarate aldolase
MVCGVSEDVLAAMAATRLVPVVVLQDAGAAAPLADALVAGGLACAEITFRTDAAEAALRSLAADGRLLVGAGTVVTTDQVDRAVRAGARFIVSPGFSTAVVRACLSEGIPVFPGTANATDIMAALDEGLSVVKFFPAEPLGGLNMISALAAPFPNLRFIPTGGITASSLKSYVDHRAVFAVGGSWMVAPALLAEGAWDEVTRLTAEAVALATS